jgi:hypothetical protein
MAGAVSLEIVVAIQIIGKEADTAFKRHKEAAKGHISLLARGQEVATVKEAASKSLKDICAADDVLVIL